MAALLITLLPLTISARLADVDVVARVLPPLIEEESHAGRELVINETHGALSTNLRLLEQQARELQHTSPALYELAVSANSRLREALTLTRVGHQTSTDVANLSAGVLTPARAVGARSEVDVRIAQLGGADPSTPFSGPKVVGCGGLRGRRVSAAAASGVGCQFRRYTSDPLTLRPIYRTQSG